MHKLPNFLFNDHLKIAWIMPDQDAFGNESLSRILSNHMIAMSYIDLKTLVVQS